MHHSDPSLYDQATRSTERIAYCTLCNLLKLIEKDVKTLNKNLTINWLINNINSVIINETYFAFCVHCILFGSGIHLTVFKNLGYNDWKMLRVQSVVLFPCMKGERLIRMLHWKHLHLKMHVKVDLDIFDLNCAFKQYDDSVRQKQESLLLTIDVVVSLGRQNILFRGNDWNNQTSTENGILRLMRVTLINKPRHLLYSWHISAFTSCFAYFMSSKIQSSPQNLMKLYCAKPLGIMLALLGYWVKTHTQMHMHAHILVRQGDDNGRWCAGNRY